MNFDKNHVAHKKSIPAGTRIFRRISLTALKIFLVLLLFCVILGTAAGVGMIKGLIASAPNIDSLSVAPAESATYIYNTGNKPVQKLAESTSNRILVKLDQIPEDLQHAVVAIEDERFYEHNGIDVRGILRAGVKALTTGSFSEGASTITQQLLKNNVFTNWTNESTQVERFTRKLQEQFLAVEIEKKIGDKNVILENYLNTINLGQNTLGVQAAANRYFGKSISELDISEAAVLAAITKSPTEYNPIKHPDANKTRRALVLKNMLDQGYISQNDYDSAMEDDIYARISEHNEETQSTNTVYSYFVDAIREREVIWPI